MRCLDRPLALLVILTLSAACAGVEPVPVQAPPTASVATLIGDAACESDAQCATIGVGAKACGGPQAYLAWSSKQTDGALLRQAAEREAQASRAAAQASGIMSNCAIAKDPGASCVAPAASNLGAGGSAAATARHCRLRAVGPGGGGSIY